jgi:dihydrofolate synthase/folylpolyglutamate synthase
VAVITSISYDHMKILGDTLTLIAGEKAGIIRPGATVISAPQVEEAMHKIEQVCQERGARLVVEDRDWSWDIAPPESLEAQTFTACGQTYCLPLLGEHQVVNAITALATIKHFSELAHLSVSDEALRAGLAKVQWRGRLEILNRDPYLIVDSAMNGDSAEKLVRALHRHFPRYKITFIFGASNDHPVKDMLKALLPVARRMIVTASIHPRAEKPETLATIAEELGFQVSVAPGAAQALEQSLTDLPPDGLVCAAGSLFLVADVREAWLRRNRLPLPPIDPEVKQD